jgi:serine/threonine protein kinase/tetratricopeptide (TPR) repeat protein
VSNRDDELNAIAAAILDGRPIDWSAVDAAGHGLVRQLQLLSALAAAHRATASRVRDSSDHRVPIPSRWGPLEVLEHIGHGSFGDVYKASDRQLDRAVALKLFPKSLIETNPSPSMLDEGRRLARVRHPNVVTIHSADCIEGRVGLWMEYVEGRTLAQTLDERGPLSVAEVVPIGVTICRALTAVHEAGLLHRDVKAQNVMVENGGRVVLMDLGTGREIANATPDLAGTPLYLAPEVLHQHPATVRSDVYGVGVLLYHLLTGTYPVTGRTVDEIRQRHDVGSAVPLRTLRPDVPERLANVITRAIEPRPEARHDSAGEMADALAALCAHTSWARPSARVVLFVAAAVLIVAALSSVRILNPRPQPATVVAPASVPPAPAELTTIAQPVSPSSSEAPVPPTPTLNFQARDWVLIVPFENRTNEAVLDGTLESALERELANSAFVNVVPHERIEDVLGLMRKPLDSTVDARLAREIALRDGAIHAFITGRIDKIGATFHISAEIVNPADGSMVTSLTEEVTAQSELLPAMRQHALKIRAALGEMRHTIRASETALERVTTPSLHAAQLYSQAAAFIRGDGTWPFQPAEELLKQAVEQDPEFASAHILLAWTIQRQRRPKEEYLPYAERARALSTRTSDVERYFIIGVHHDLVAKSIGDVGIGDSNDHRRLAIAAFETVLKLKPDHNWATGLLGNLYGVLKSEPRATELTVRYADLRPTNLTLRWSASMRYFEQGDTDRGRFHLKKAEALITPDFTREHPEYETTIFRVRVGDAWLPMNVKRVRQLADVRTRRIAVIASSTPAAAGMNQDLVGIYNALGRTTDAARAAHNVPVPLREQTVTQVLLAETGPQIGQGKASARDALLRHLTDAYPNLETIPATPLFVSSLIQVGKVNTLRAIVDRAKRDGFVLFGNVRSRWMVDAAEARLALTEGNIEEASRLFQKAAENGGPALAQTGDGPVTFADAWVKRGDRRRAIAVLEDATRDRWTSSAAGAVFAGIGVRVSAWMGAANKLSELYREEGRRREADALDRDLFKLLSEAESDFPLLVRLTARQRALK